MPSSREFISKTFSVVRQRHLCVCVCVCRRTQILHSCNSLTSLIKSSSCGLKILRGDGGGPREFLLYGTEFSAVQRPRRSHVSLLCTRLRRDYRVVGGWVGRGRGSKWCDAVIRFAGRCFTVPAHTGKGEGRGANTSRRCSQSPRTWSARPSWAAAARGAASAREPPRWTRRQSCWRRWRPGLSGRTAASPSWPAARSSPCSAPRNTSSRRHISVQRIHTTTGQLIIITQQVIIQSQLSKTIHTRRIRFQGQNLFRCHKIKGSFGLYHDKKCAGYIINVNRKYFIYFLFNLT